MANTLRFLLNGKRVELTEVDPHLSLLDFVRGRFGPPPAHLFSEAGEP